MVPRGSMSRLCFPASLQDGASAFILDLRDNSGGVVGSGYSIAQLLLKDGDGFCVVRFGSGEEEVVQVQEASHLLTQPLVSPNLALSEASYPSSCSHHVWRVLHSFGPIIS